MTALILPRRFTSGMPEGQLVARSSGWQQLYVFNSFRGKEQYSRFQSLGDATKYAYLYAIAGQTYDAGGVIYTNKGLICKAEGTTTNGAGLRAEKPATFIGTYVFKWADWTAGGADNLKYLFHSGSPARNYLNISSPTTSPTISGLLSNQTFSGIALGVGSITGRDLTLVIRIDAGFVDAWLNGVSLGRGTYSNTGYITDGDRIDFSSANYYSNREDDSAKQIIGYNPALLSANDCIAISADPWNTLFVPRKSVLYFGGGTPTNYPSAADSGSITLTGSTANGVRSLAGVAASGSITLTGSAANAVRALAGVAASGSITLTGSNAAALRTWLGVAGAGSITLTGSDAVGVKAGSGAYTSAADAGSITLSGSAAVGTYDRLAAAGSGSITLTGSDASGIRNIPATAEAGSIALTGSAAVGIRTWLAAAEAGSITLTGSDAEGVFGGAMTLTQADLDAIAAAVWADPAAVAAHAKLDAIIARITC